MIRCIILLVEIQFWIWLVIGLELIGSQFSIQLGGLQLPIWLGCCYFFSFIFNNTLICIFLQKAWMRLWKFPIWILSTLGPVFLFCNLHLCQYLYHLWVVRFCISYQQKFGVQLTTNVIETFLNNASIGSVCNLKAFSSRAAGHSCG